MSTMLNTDRKARIASLLHFCLLAPSSVPERRKQRRRQKAKAAEDLKGIALVAVDLQLSCRSALTLPLCSLQVRNHSEGSK